MECRLKLYWEDDEGEHYQTDVPAYLFDIVNAQIGTEYNLYGYEENTPHIRSNRFVVVGKMPDETFSGMHVTLIEKISYEEAIKIYPDL